MNQTSKVMIVEDEAIIAQDLQVRLTSLGFTVTGTARTAADAFREIERETPDLVLMDIRIQGDMDGVAAANIVRSRYALPVIYLTAHADEATLARAQQTQPFGYLVKPLGNANMKAVITMALYKHRIERELESHRKMLSTILQGLPDAVLVADGSGELLFLNRKAEELTGWSQAEAIGRSLVEVAPIEEGSGRLVSSELLQRATTQGGAVRIPRDSVLLTKNRGTIEIAGQLAATAEGNRAAGVFVTLQDVTVQKREDQRLRQEQQMYVAGELAVGVAREFYGLFTLIEEGAAGMMAGGEKAEAEFIRSATQIGKSMSTNLMDLREAHGEAHVVNVNQYLQASQQLLRRLGGPAVQVEVVSKPDAGYVLSTGNHFEQVLLNLVFDGKQRLDGGAGKITVSADVHTQTLSPSRCGSYVRIAVRSEKPVSGQAAETSSGEDSMFGATPPDLGLALVRAITIASEGFMRISETSDWASLVEVFLPRHESRAGAVAATNEYPNVILLIGMPAKTAGAVRRAAGGDVLILEASNLDEATLISELYASDLDLIISNDKEALPKKNTRGLERIRAHRPDATFWQVAGNGSKGLGAGDLERQVGEFLHRKAMPAVASAV